MSDLTRKRFAQRGQQLQLEQLDAVRRQAEGWRNGLGGLTGLVGVVFVVKGRGSVAGMPESWRIAVVALLVGAFVLLLTGTLLAIRACHGGPGTRGWLAADELMGATLDEVARTQRALTTARLLSTVGVCAIVAAVAVSWLGPVRC